MLTATRNFTLYGLLSVIGVAFYYAHLFLGVFDNAVLFRLLAVVFLFISIPLPIIALTNAKLFPALERRTKNIVTMGAMLLFMHNFLMTFIFVMFLPGTSNF